MDNSHISLDSNILLQPLSNDGYEDDDHSYEHERDHNCHSSKIMDDEDALRNEIDSEIGLFDLPLKHGGSLYQNNNFSQTDDDWDSFNGSFLGSPTFMHHSRKVRFSKNTNYITLNDEISKYGNNNSNNNFNITSGCSSVSSMSKSKQNVEELLYSASQFNDYLSQNLENMNTPGKPLSDSKSLYKLIYENQTTSGLNTKNNSNSNFNLADNDDLTTDETDDTDSIRYNRINSGCFHREYSSFSGKSSPLNCELSSGQDNNRYEKELEKTLFEKISSHQFARDINISDHVYPTDSLEYTAIKIADHQSVSSVDVIALSIEESMANFIQTFELLYNLSENYDRECHQRGKREKHQLPIEHRQFLMKNPPSISYQDFIKRIQSKCNFNPCVYLTATYLLQIMFLTKSSDNDTNNTGLALKLRMMNNGIHRLIIALVRISTRLIEDQLHSHEYFSKVCGISKKLLSHLEVNLLICLHNQRLMITAKKLNASVAILKELRTTCERYF